MATAHAAFYLPFSPELPKQKNKSASVEVSAPQPHVRQRRLDSAMSSTTPEVTLDATPEATHTTPEATPTTPEATPTTMQKPRLHIQKLRQRQKLRQTLRRKLHQKLPLHLQQDEQTTPSHPHALPPPPPPYPARVLSQGVWLQLHIFVVSPYVDLTDLVVMNRCLEEELLLVHTVRFIFHACICVLLMRWILLSL